jgi:hypothetical protein
MPGPVNSTCHATTTAVAARRAVTTRWRFKRMSMFDTIAASAGGVFDAGGHS